MHVNQKKQNRLICDRRGLCLATVFPTLVVGLFLAVSGCDTGNGLTTLPGGPIGGTFATATILTLEQNKSANLSASLSGDKADVYALGPVGPGDRIIVSVKPANGSPLDPVIGIFDSNEELFALNDDVDFEAGLIESAVDEVVTTANSKFFLAVSKFSSGNAGGAYTGTVEIRRSDPIPPRPIQVLILDFNGGTVTIPSEGTITVGAFDAANIDPTYSGLTAQIKATIAATVRSNFSGYGITVLTTDDAGLPASNFSTMLFGGFSQTKFGIAENVDQGNRDCCDDGIVYTDDFDKPFATRPSADGIAIAIGNVASHEAGHLLGLNHTADILDLMDTTGTASTLLGDQNFKTAPLSTSIFPMGKQNGPAMLARVIPAP